ncbi:store-operated calcium entry-associated regulatory factor [Callorhinchus milii]|uniref:Store-operated calcium entry-associated regulatory factor n=1 Tax=Callorhinchus milii TaxID=7868 RepID=V9KPW8_CALMI|nr:store-operated calcium entry-associated regulatory factor [Callorhinchus milii]|eukprot:gi/632949319/ref/XP_007890090.1/ PREDICTED: store-operated calcium entry-associated regulatory factor [Callorhinchus milii]
MSPAGGLLLLLALAEAWDGSDRILLREIQALTLYNGRYTNGRRTKSVPQLKCVGGTAGCGTFIPEVVQCYNKGWDGYDVQWECKTDMDHAYRFGTIMVTCEGYNYPEDPYVLQGSCGLEYMIELTEEGYRKRKSNTGFYSGSPNYQTSYSSDSSNVVVVLILLGVAYLLYKVFLSHQQLRNQAASDGSGFSGPYGPGPHGPGPHGPYPTAPPPPPGFKPDFTGDEQEGFRGGPHQGNNYGPRNAGNSSGPGFWSGMGAGGLLGYLMGSRRSQPSPSYPYSWGHQSHPPPHRNMSGINSPGTSGTRTASGFGGTQRR